MTTIAVVHLGAVNPASPGTRFWPLLTYLSARDFDVTVVTPAPMAAAVRRSFPNAKTLDVFQPFRNSSYVELVLNYASALLASMWMRPPRIDVSIALTGAIYDLVAALRLARRAKAPAVAYIDNLPVRGRPERTWWSALDRLAGAVSEKLYSHFDLIFAGSESVERALAGYGIPPARVLRTSYGIGGDALKKAHMSNIRPVSGRVVYLGRFTRAKGIFDLIEAWPEIVRAVPAATLHVMGIGDSNTERELRQKISSVENGRTSISLLGFVSDEIKFRELLAAELMVFPSYSEQYCQAVAEALACGVPVVAYDIEGIRSNFPGAVSVGPIGDVHSLAARAIGELRSPRRVTFQTAESFNQFFDAEQAKISELLSRR